MARRYGRYTAETTDSDFNTNPKKCYFFHYFCTNNTPFATENIHAANDRYN